MSRHLVWLNHSGQRTNHLMHLWCQSLKWEKEQRLTIVHITEMSMWLLYSLFFLFSTCYARSLGSNTFCNHRRLSKGQTFILHWGEEKGFLNKVLSFERHLGVSYFKDTRKVFKTLGTASTRESAWCTSGSTSTSAWLGKRLGQ